MKKPIIFTLIIIVLAGAVYWYGSRSGWFGNGVPSNPPTAEDLRRIEAVEESSSQIDPNAKAGIGVRPVGSIPKPPPPTEEYAATTTDEDSSE